jgi:WD40 repeat protein
MLGLLAGGTFNGDIILWNVGDATPITHSTMSCYSHQEPVSVVEWISTAARTGYQLLSAGNDGKIILWDMLDLTYPVSLYLHISN